ncbi:MAG: tripartite tricarboxylate transporter TctB family protein [Inquilinus sp.]|nr:tripartite tricarboxylate transporter TctB family protein [Inquilinus sp.]
MTRDRIGALFFLAVSIAYGLMSLDIRVPPFASEGFTARSLPLALSAAGTLIAFLMLVLPQKDGPGVEPAGRFLAGLGGFDWPRIAGLALNMLAYGFLLTRVGFLVSTILFLIVGYRLLGERRWHVLLLASVPVVVVFWAILTQLLDIFLGSALGRWGQLLAAQFSGGA